MILITDARTSITVLSDTPVKMRSKDKENIVVFSCYQIGSFELIVFIRRQSKHKESVQSGSKSGIGRR
jgi:hypothetical protein